MKKMNCKKEKSAPGGTLKRLGMACLLIWGVWCMAGCDRDDDDLEEETETGVTQSGTAGNLTWSLSGGTLTISGSGAIPDYDYREFPWYSFWENITAVIIENGVTAIGSAAFAYCSSLTSVTIPHNYEYNVLSLHHNNNKKNNYENKEMYFNGKSIN